jgi:predicted RNA-binding protein with TRAM domain
MDGNAATSWGSASCSHTNAESVPWWNVQLAQPYKVLAVQVTNRGDCCSSRLDGFTVEVDGNVCASSVPLGSGATTTVECVGVGRNIKVYKDNGGGSDWFTICEFNFAYAAGAVTMLDLTGKTYTQSSISHSPQPPVAVDGNWDTSWGSSSCTHTGPDSNPWWQVDLGETKTVTGIEITNRGDCCSSRLSGFTVYVGDSTCCSDVALGSGETKFVACDTEVSGSTIKVTKLGVSDWFTICEFAAFESIAL